MGRNGKGSGWHNEGRRHALAARGINSADDIWKEELCQAQEEYLERKEYWRSFSIQKQNEVMDLMREEGIETDMASPNFVKDFADNRDIYLTSDEVVELSNYYTLEDKASGIPKNSRKDMEKFLWHSFNDQNPNLTNEEVRNYRKFIAKKTDSELRESYDRQVVLSRPLSRLQQREIDAGVDSLIRSKARRRN